MTYYLFPFDKVPKGSRIVLYGAGIVGKQFYDQVVETGFCEIVLWLDKKADGALVKEPNNISNLNADDYDFVVIAIESKAISLEVKKFLTNYGIPENKILDSIHISSEFRKQIENKKKQETLNLIPNIKPLEGKNSPQYVVSLASYKKRLNVTAPYAIITLLNQNVKPDRVVLWVAHEDKENIPDILYKLQEKGLEIHFCEDLKSYNKLIPALLEFPDSCIITADDDVYYPTNWLEQMITLHQKNTRKIICHRAHGIKVDENHNLLPYSKWDSCIEPSIYFAMFSAPQKQSESCHCLKSAFPTGVGGVLYPSNCLHKEVLNKELFMKLTPHGDDIWFWVMAVINKEYFGEESPYIVVSKGYSQNLQYVELEQNKNGNALWNYNCGENGNDKQLKAVIEHYPQIKKDLLGKIEKYCYGILVPCGFVMKLDTTDWVQKGIYERGCYEKEHVLALLSLMPQDGIFFDIGANVGVYSLNFCKKAKGVYSFEATEKTYKHLLETIYTNDIKNIYHNFNAVHSESGIDVEIWQGNEVLGNDNNGNNGMFSKGGMANIVKSISIDDFVKKHNVDRIDVIKIDIEGNELNALKGARDSILRFRPVILCEVNPEMNERAGYTSQELCDFIIDTLNYKPTIFADNKLLPANTDVVVSSQCNVFFIPTEKEISSLVVFGDESKSGGSI